MDKAKVACLVDMMVSFMVMPLTGVMCPRGQPVFVRDESHATFREAPASSSLPVLGTAEANLHAIGMYPTQ